jgi:hypothetical protein
VSKALNEIKVRFMDTMLEVSSILGVDPSQIMRDEYIRCAVDNDLDGRLNKTELNLLGGFRKAKVGLFPSVVPKPKVLIYDIETAPIISHVWSLWNNNVGLNQIQKDWHLLSWSAKWLGEDRIYYQDQRNAKNIEDDKKILKGIWELLNEADIVVTQNGKKFDEKKLNARFIINGFQPPSSYKHIDTLQIAKRKFGFTSNRLEYMTGKLCKKYKKGKHKKFPGHELWSECLKGNIEAWNEMQEYNEVDVLSLEELFVKFSPWSNEVNFNLYHDELVSHCKCGGNYKKDGYAYTQKGKFQRYRCGSCGSQVRDSHNLFDKEKKKQLKVNL